MNILSSFFFIGIFLINGPLLIFGRSITDPVENDIQKRIYSSTAAGDEELPKVISDSLLDDSLETVTRYDFKRQTSLDSSSKLPLNETSSTSPLPDVNVYNSEKSLSDEVEIYKDDNILKKNKNEYNVITSPSMILKNNETIIENITENIKTLSSQQPSPFTKQTEEYVDHESASTLKNSFDYQKNYELKNVELKKKIINKKESQYASSDIPDKTNLKADKIVKETNLKLEKQSKNTDLLSKAMGSDVTTEAFGNNTSMDIRQGNDKDVKNISVSNETGSNLLEVELINSDQNEKDKVNNYSNIPLSGTFGLKIEATSAINDPDNKTLISKYSIKNSVQDIDDETTTPSLKHTMIENKQYSSSMNPMRKTNYSKVLNLDYSKNTIPFYAMESSTEATSKPTSEINNLDNINSSNSYYNDIKNKVKNVEKYSLLSSIISPKIDTFSEKIQFETSTPNSNDDFINKIELNTNGITTASILYSVDKSVSTSSKTSSKNYTLQSSPTPPEINYSENPSSENQSTTSPVTLSNDLLSKLATESNIIKIQPEPNNETTNEENLARSSIPSAKVNFNYTISSFQSTSTPSFNDDISAVTDGNSSKEKTLTIETTTPFIDEESKSSDSSEPNTTLIMDSNESDNNQTLKSYTQNPALSESTKESESDFEIWSKVTSYTSSSQSYTKKPLTLTNKSDFGYSSSSSAGPESLLISTTPSDFISSTTESNLIESGNILTTSDLLENNMTTERSETPLIFRSSPIGFDITTESTDTVFSSIQQMNINQMQNESTTGFNTTETDFNYSVSSSTILYTPKTSETLFSSDHTEKLTVTDSSSVSTTPISEKRFDQSNTNKDDMVSIEFSSSSETSSISSSTIPILKSTTENINGTDMDEYSTVSIMHSSFSKSSISSFYPMIDSSLSTQSISENISDLSSTHEESTVSPIYTSSEMSITSHEPSSHFNLFTSTEDANAVTQSSQSIMFSEDEILSDNTTADGITILSTLRTPLINNTTMAASKLPNNYTINMDENHSHDYMGTNKMYPTLTITTHDLMDSSDLDDSAEEWMSNSTFDHNHHKNVQHFHTTDHDILQQTTSSDFDDEDDDDDDKSKLENNSTIEIIRVKPTAASNEVVKSNDMKPMTSTTISYLENDIFGNKSKDQLLPKQPSIHNFTDKPVTAINFTNGPDLITSVKHYDQTTDHETYTKKSIASTDFKEESSTPTLTVNNVNEYILLHVHMTYFEICRSENSLRKAIITLFKNGTNRILHPNQIVFLNLTQEKCSKKTNSEKVIVEMAFINESGELSPKLNHEFYRLYNHKRFDKEWSSKIKDIQLMERELGEIIHEEMSTSSMIAAITISGIGLLCLLLLGILLVILRKRQRGFNFGKNCTPVSLDEYSLDNTSVYNSVRRKTAIRASKRSYGNPAFDDPACTSHILNFAGLSKFCLNRKSIDEEYSLIPTVTPKMDELPPGAETKNRYANVIPLPETRVHLSSDGTEPLADYINANYVKGPKGVDKFYIACQAPMSSTVNDFWRMIWEQQCKVIMMLTDLHENGVEKCHDYLPPSEVLDCHRLFGDYQITLKKREVREKYLISTLQLKNLETNLWREVTHLWYISWPHQGVPNEGTSIIAFLIEARSYMRNSTGPHIIHCSPGTGRTGTVLAIDLCIRDFEINRSVDIPKTVFGIRRDRAGAVQTKDQYAFIYQVLNIYATKLTGGSLDSI